MIAVLFPLWQIDQQDYRTICAYLGITPEAHLYDRLSQYLAAAPFRFDRPTGFSLFLAKLPLTRFRIARLDLATKLFLAGHPARHVLNGVIALHECDGKGYREMAATSPHLGVPLSVLRGMVGFAFSLAVTTAWLCWQFVTYVATTPFRAKDDLTGKRVLITGVNRGLGMDLMLHCLENGAEVIGTARSYDILQDVQTRIPASAPVRLLVADLSKPQELVASVREAQIAASSIDIAILCAGVKYSGRSVLSLPELRDTFQVNFFSSAEFAAWFGECDSAASPTPILGEGTNSGGAGSAVMTNETPTASTSSRPRMPESVPAAQRTTDRTLVVISSMGRWHGMHFSCGYNASKAALSIWAESLEMEISERAATRLRILIVEPGMFESGMAHQTGLARLLLGSRRQVAQRIVSGALTGKRSIRPPFWFALLTWGACLGGRRLRYRLFTSVNK
jgi:short-subunit dehydrogenase